MHTYGKSLDLNMDPNLSVNATWYVDGQYREPWLDSPHLHGSLNVLYTTLLSFVLYVQVSPAYAHL